jgi:salicylate hydroxylase
MPNASRVLQSWDFVPEKSGMVAMHKGSLIDGTNMRVLVPNFFEGSESRWGFPMYAVHREDLHIQLELLATQENGPGNPCDIRVRSKVVDYVRKPEENPTIIL